MGVSGVGGPRSAGSTLDHTFNTGNSELDDMAKQYRTSLLAPKKLSNGQSASGPDEGQRRVARRFDYEVNKIDKSLSGDALKKAVQKAGFKAQMYAMEMSMFEGMLKKAQEDNPIWEKE